MDLPSEQWKKNIDAIQWEDKGENVSTPLGCSEEHVPKLP